MLCSIVFLSWYKNKLRNDGLNKFKCTKKYCWIVRIDYSCINFFLNNFNSLKKSWQSHWNYKTLPQKFGGIPTKLLRRKKKLAWVLGSQCILWCHQAIKLTSYLILFHSSPFVGRRPSVEYLSGRHFLLLHIINMWCNGSLICYHIKYAFFMYEINILSTLCCAVNLDVSFIYLQQRRIEIL